MGKNNNAKPKRTIFGERLRLLRKVLFNNMSQKEMSALTGIPQPSLSAYENGKNKPTISILLRISEKCHVSVDWLCGKSANNQIMSMGDIAECLINLTSIQELMCKIEVSTGEGFTDCNKLILLPRASESEVQLDYFNEVSQLIAEVHELHNWLVNYECSQEYFNEKKAELIRKYSVFSVTSIDYSHISEAERKCLYREKLKDEVRKELLMEFRQKNS